MKDGFTIGELARRCGVSRDAVRFYERERLMARPRRTPAGYRLYGREDEQRLLFIRRAQRVGLTLEDVAELIRLHDAHSPTECRTVAERLEHRVQAVDSERRSWMRTQGATLAGSALSGLLASACCIGPLVLSLLGVSGAAFAQRFEPLRPCLLVLTFGLLAAAFYSTYRPGKAACAP